MEFRRPNGHPGPALVPRPGVPLVGQPFSIDAWFMTVQIKCYCGAHHSVLVVGRIGAAAACPACGRLFQLRGLTSDTSGNLQIQIAMGTVEAPADGEGGSDV